MEKPSEVPIVRDAPKPTLKWLWLLVALVLVAVVAIGVGVGLWHTRRKGSSGIRYYLLRCTHTHSLTLSVNQAPVRRLPTRQQHVHPPMHPLYSISSTIHHWPRSFFPTMTDICIFRIVLVASDPSFARHQPISGIQIPIRISVQVQKIIHL